MFLRSLTLRGFKSFADKTVLDFEPGVTVVVGPNGTGKSNLVDAVAWVLGAQGPRTMRSGKMDDVIFAGTPGRPALGRAEVSLTIDNEAGLLPIDLSEVTITRTLFRETNQSEYAVNGAPCRLIDVQELLSDSGIGRQQHVIVGQGQLDTVLTARSEDRRAIIEEAAGVLKFRRRRERAARRLEATEGSVLRLTDLVREVRRQLGPLERQADAARRHDGVAAELRAIRLHLVGHEIAGLQGRRERLRDERADLATAEAAVHARLGGLDDAVLELETALGTIGDDDLADWLVRVEALRGRARGLGALAAERRRGSEGALVAAADEGVLETLVADAAAARGELDELDADATGLVPRADALAAREAAAGGELAALDHGRDPDTEVRDADAARARAEGHWRSAEAEAARARARADALAAALGDQRARSGAELLDAVPGIVGMLADHLEIDPGAEAAADAALDEALRAVVVADADGARAALDRLAGEGDVSALLLLADEPGDAPPATAALTTEGTTRLTDLVRSPQPAVRALLARLLGSVVVAEGGRDDALDIAVTRPDVVVVTRAGNRFGGRRPWRLGGAPHEVTRRELVEAEAAAAATEIERHAAERGAAEAKAALDAARARRTEVGEARERARRLIESRLAAAADERRALEMHAAGFEARRRVVSTRLASITERLERRRAGGEAEAAVAAERQRAELVTRAEQFGLVEARVAKLLDTADALHDRLREQRRRRSEDARAGASRLKELRAERASLDMRLAELRERTGRADIEAAETRVRLDAAVERIRTELDCEPDSALDAPRPEVPEGATLGGRARELAQELRRMGPINPLALSELDALAERHRFLTEQLDDVRSSRRELGRVIRAVDREIVAAFETAYADVAEHFEVLFATLFPGGAGRLSLTDPGNLLETGIEIEARPSGKNVRRLSLLSGGERSLTALAYLFAVFRARPSPFYLLDEVEAALDDINLHRFLDLVHEFRDEAQLVVVTHQKRTMEAADVLYGVSMAPGQTSRVVSQRVTGELVPG